MKFWHTPCRNRKGLAPEVNFRHLWLYFLDASSFYNYTWNSLQGLLMSCSWFPITLQMAWLNATLTTTLPGNFIADFKQTFFAIYVDSRIQSCHKVLNGISAPCLRENLVRLNVLPRGYELRDSETDLKLPKPKTNFLKRSFQYSASTLWNDLSTEAKKATNLNEFKRLISNVPFVEAV